MATHTDRTSLWVRFQPITVVLWWLLIFLIGWAAFPTLYVLLPGLADRGYPLSRMFSLLAAAWVGWILARSKIVPWSGWSAIIGLMAMAALSGSGLAAKSRALPAVSNAGSGCSP